MIQDSKLQKLREMCLNKDVFSPEVLAWIAKENLWNIWVPISFGGLEMSFTDGLQKLKHLAKIDGSLGWTITLCSGANYFIGNLSKTAAEEIFLQPNVNACLGGSGGVFGTAEKIGNDHYRLSGEWRYATGAPYLSHFTLNAEILQDGKKLLQENDSPKVLSFVIPKKDVQIIEDWNSMGLKASATHSFKVDKLDVHKNFSFIYNEFHLPQDIFKIPFLVFADLTLWVNYIGMAEHFLEEAKTIRSGAILDHLKNSILTANEKLNVYAEEIERKTSHSQNINSDYIEKIHSSASASVKNITRSIIEAYPFLGIRASQKNHVLNQIFRDYFTATQHHIFTK